MQKFEKDLSFSYPTGVVPIANASPLVDTSSLSPVVRGSALANVSRPSASNVVSNQNVGGVASRSQASILQSQLDGLDAQISALESQWNDLNSCYTTQKALHDDLKLQLSKSDALSNISPFKFSASKRNLVLQQIQDAYNKYQNCYLSMQSVKDSLSKLAIQRNAIASQLTSLGVPRGARSIRKPMETRASLGEVASKIAEDVGTNVTDALKDVPGVGGMFGGGGGGAMGGGDEQLGDAPKSFFEENKLAIFVLGGSLAFLILKN
jgi:hypothetical protein